MDAYPQNASWRVIAQTAWRARGRARRITTMLAHRDADPRTVLGFEISDQATLLEAAE